jgi:hypothetical protein
MAGCNSMERIQMRNNLDEIKLRLIYDDESTLDTILNCGEIAKAFPSECCKMLEILKPISEWLTREIEL